MRKAYLIPVFSLFLLFSLSLVAMPAEAQQTDNSTDNSSVVYIGSGVTLEDYDLSSDWVMTFTLDSDRTGTPIKASDVFSGVSQGGVKKGTSKRFTLDKGENTLKMEVTPHDGDAALSIATSSGWITITEQTSTDVFTDTYPAESVIIFMVVGSGVGISAVVVTAIKRKRDKKDEYERIL